MPVPIFSAHQAPGRRPTSRRRGCLYLLLSLLALTAAAWLLRSPLLTAIGNALVEDDGPQKAQAAVVLGGDGFGMRITKAAQLAQSGYVPYVIVSGPRNLIGYECDVTIEYARRRGYPASLFHPLPVPTDTTRDETAFIGQYLKSKSIHKILLVTSNYHTRRAARLMRNQNPWLQVVVVAAPDSFFTPGNWWRSRKGLKTFFFEASKTVATWMGL